VARIEGGNVLERQASVREGDIEDALRSRVHAPQRDLAAPLIAQATLEEPEPSAVDGGPRTGHGDEEDGEEREEAAHLFSVPADAGDGDRNNGRADPRSMLRPCSPHRAGGEAAPQGTDSDGRR